MSVLTIDVCPGTLKAGFSTYSPATLRKVFNGRKVSHILPYPAPRRSEQTNTLFMENRQQISISGVQEKLSLILDKNKLRLTEKGEQGTHILKPMPRDLKKVSQVPANEHLTMQIASQVYGLQTAENALIFFSDGEAAYITKRFDVKLSGQKWGQEDFASLAGRTSENAGPDFKYDYDYTRLGQLIQQYIPAWRVEMEKYFGLVVFNFLFSNGDAHLKNFSALETAGGDYLLSPAYDLINTRIHVDDPVFALNGGLMQKDVRSAVYQRTGNPGLNDFINFGKAIGVSQARIEKILNPFLERQEKVEALIWHSFLDEATKKTYLLHYNTRRNLLGVM